MRYHLSWNKNFIQLLLFETSVETIKVKSKTLCNNTGEFAFMPQLIRYSFSFKKESKWTFKYYKTHLFTPFWWVPEIIPYFSNVSEFQRWIAGLSPNSPVAIKFDYSA